MTARHGEPGETHIDELGNVNRTCRINYALSSAIRSGAFSDLTVPYSYVSGGNVFSVFKNQIVCALKPEASLLLGLGIPKSSATNGESMRIVPAVNGIPIKFDHNSYYAGVPDIIKFDWISKDILRLFSFVGFGSSIGHFDAVDNGPVAGNANDHNFPITVQGHVTGWFAKINGRSIAPNTRVKLALPKPGDAVTKVTHTKTSDMVSQAVEFTVAEESADDITTTVAKTLYVAVGAITAADASVGDDSLDTRTKIRRDKALKSDFQIGNQFIDGIMGIVLLLGQSGHLNDVDYQKNALNIAKTMCQKMLELELAQSEFDKVDTMLVNLSSVNKQYAARAFGEVCKSISKAVLLDESIGTVTGNGGTSSDGLFEQLDILIK